MANFYGNDQVELLKNSLDIVRVIESYVPLKKLGRSFTACCPFHEEKTPSFHVNPDKQSFYCFGGSCNKGGDVITFVQEIDKLTFSEAVEALAERAGVTLTPQHTGGSEAPRSQREEMYKANRFAADYYVQALKSEGGAKALAYLAGRGITDSMVARFELGCSTPGLVRAIRKAGYDNAAFERVGLIGTGSYGDGYYERFRDRVMFPIKDIRGRVTGFGARILESGGDAKYINSAANDIFDKKQNLYGIELLKEMEDGAPVVIVEGYTDVIGLYQSGFRGAVATLGTALGPAHVKTLRRFADDFVMLFDPDEAGTKAAERSIGLFVEESVNVAFITLPDNQDPFEFVIARGLEAFKHEMEGARTMYAFKRMLVEQRYPRTDTDSTARKVNELVKTFMPTPDLVKRELIMKSISQDYGVSMATLGRISGTDASPASAAPAAPPPSPALVTAEENVIKTYIMHPELFEATHEQLNPALLQQAPLRLIYENSIRQFETDGTFDPVRLLSYIQAPEPAAVIARHLNAPERLSFEEAAQTSRESIIFILRKSFERKERKLREEYLEAERKGDETLARQCMCHLDIVQKQKHALAR